MSEVSFGIGIPDENRGVGRMILRYEDVAQHGGIKVHCLPHGMGLVAFGKLWNQTPLARKLRMHGVLPILSRVHAQSLQWPIAVFQPLEVEAWYQLGHTRDELGGVQRVLLNLGADLYAPRGRTHDPQPAGAGERIHVGRVLAEHIFTRPFAKVSSERRVTSLEVDGESQELGPVLPLRDAKATLGAPADSVLTAPFEEDAAPVVFGLAHTDSNQHVNSLAYIPLFEDAVLRRLSSLGLAAGNLHLQSAELAYRKPCFAGESMRLWLALFEREGRVLARVYLGEPETTPERAHCMGALEFTRI